MKNRDAFKIKRFSATRISSIDVLEAGRKKHHIKALVELDVTEAREKIDAAQKIKKDVTFTSWLIKTISRTIEEVEDIHAFLKSKRSKIVFDDIDISVMVEKEVAGEKLPIVYIVRQTNKKDIAVIAEEIRSAKEKKLSDGQALSETRYTGWAALYTRLPGFVRRWVWSYLLRSPKTAQRMMGSVVFTSVGMFGSIRGWFIQTSIHPLAFGVGSIVKKPAVIEEEIAIREFLYLTILMDHDVIDGVPMAKFVSTLGRHVENGLGLE